MSALYRLKSFFSVSMILLGLAACQTPNLESSRPGVNKPSNLITDRHSANILFNNARRLAPPQRDRQLLRAASILHNLKDTAAAKRSISNIDPLQLSDLEYASYAQLYGNLLTAEDEVFAALELITASRLENIWQQLSLDNALSLRRLRADLWGLLGDINNSIAELHRIAELPIDDTTELNNNNAIWQLLTQLPSKELTKRAKASKDRQMRGWYLLALLGRDTQAGIRAQRAAIDNWQQQWPQHTATNHPPQALQLLQQLKTQQIEQLALLLPLSGPLAGAGQAVRDGFMAAYYAALDAGAPASTISIYDTAGEQSFTEIYQHAVADGAQMIVGPLDKSNLTSLLEGEKVSVPTLALNYSDNGHSGGNLVQFGLAIEDEARQAARQAYRLGHRQAMILAPKSNWGQRGSTAFTQEWTRLGGTVSLHQTYLDNSKFPQLISKALLIPSSESRKHALRRKLGVPLKFTPRRRGDIDMLFLLAQPQQARQINPLLTFFYAAKLPVFATSQVFAGSVNPQRDSDINGIRFTAPPWLFEDHNPIKQTIVKHALPAPAFTGLYALGVDAFQLLPRLPILRQLPNQQLRGLTGSLSLSADGRILRKQMWARIDKGRPKPIPALLNPLAQ
ncbi:MAG: penicillin-binding protein activator [Gammaproteobacteria bacterium]|nr:penicillin-binding protein activator [Gammaproteobacteria bacterium]